MSNKDNNQSENAKNNEKLSPDDISNASISAIIETDDKLIKVTKAEEKIVPEAPNKEKTNFFRKPSSEKIKKEKPKKDDGISYFYEFIKGLVKENPTLVGLLGMCPTLAITTMAINGIGMGLATTFVLVCSNIVISLLKNIIPKAVRLPCFIVIIAAFVTFVSFILKGYIPFLYDALGLYLALITVNCIILGRAEVFASKNKIVPSILDGLGMGLGFTLSLFAICSVREILGSGSWLGIAIPVLTPMTIFILPAGGFFVLGCIIALVNKLANKKPPQELGCHGCPNQSSCQSCKGGND